MYLLTIAADLTIVGEELLAPWLVPPLPRDNADLVDVDSAGSVQAIHSKGGSVARAARVDRVAREEELAKGREVGIDVAAGEEVGPAHPARLGRIRSEDRLRRVDLYTELPPAAQVVPARHDRAASKCA